MRTEGFIVGLNHDGNSRIVTLVDFKTIDDHNKERETNLWCGDFKENITTAGFGTLSQIKPNTEIKILSSRGMETTETILLVRRSTNLFAGHCQLTCKIISGAEHEIRNGSRILILDA